jgi:two-component system OmpR family response regulator
VTRRQLLEDVWRLAHDPQTNSVEVHVSRLRSKLAAAGCAELVETVPQGGYRLCLLADLPFLLTRRPTPDGDALDRYLRDLEWNGVPATHD